MTTSEIRCDFGSWTGIDCVANASVINAVQTDATSQFSTASVVNSMLADSSYQTMASRAGTNLTFVPPPAVNVTTTGPEPTPEGTPAGDALRPIVIILGVIGAVTLVLVVCLCCKFCDCSSGGAQQRPVQPVVHQHIYLDQARDAPRPPA
eukprot:45152_1